MNKLLRVNLQQPALPHYRVPLFRLLAQNKKWAFTVFHGSEEPDLMNAPADGFRAELHLARQFKLPAIGALFWHSVQWTLSSRKHSDVLVLSWHTRYLSLFPALLRARFNRIPVVLWGHGYSKSPNGLRNVLRNLPVSLSSKVLLYDNQTRIELIKAGLPAEKLHVAANGLDSELIRNAREYWQQRPAELQDFVKTHHLVDGPVLIHISRLMEGNRLDVVIRALPKLLPRFPSLKLVIIGEGQRERERLQSLADELQLQSSITWVGEVYDEFALAPWMLSADVFVYPTNAGLGLIHAFNYGLPALLCAPRSQHNPEAEALVHTRNGWLADSLSAEAIVAGLPQIIESPERQRQFSQEAFASVEQQFNTRAMARSISTLVESLADTTMSEQS